MLKRKGVFYIHADRIKTRSWSNCNVYVHMKMSKHQGIKEIHIYHIQCYAEAR